MQSEVAKRDRSNSFTTCCSERSRSAHGRLRRCLDFEWVYRLPVLVIRKSAATGFPCHFSEKFPVHTLTTREGHTNSGVAPCEARLEDLKDNFTSNLANLKRDLGERDCAPPTNAETTNLDWGYLAIHPVFTPSYDLSFKKLNQSSI
jgi:hypothetical protein